MQVIGTIRLFVENKTTKEGKEFKVFSTTISHKNEDNTFTNARMRVALDKERFTQASLEKLKEGVAYEVELKNAWLDTHAFQRENGTNGREITLYIKDAVFKSSKECKANNGLGI